MIFSGLPTFVLSQAQGLKRYGLFTIENDDIFWTNRYDYSGSLDSLRRHIVQMLKSKFYTFNVIRNEAGYNGEIRHYKVDCQRYGRTYLATPRMYWEGEWTGKFTVSVQENGYTVTVYALYYERPEQSTGYYRTEKLVKSRYIDAVTKRKSRDFKRGEFDNLALMSVGLKDSFDIRSNPSTHGD